MEKKKKTRFRQFDSFRSTLVHFSSTLADFLSTLVDFSSTLADFSSTLADFSPTLADFSSTRQLSLTFHQLSRSPRQLSLNYRQFQECVDEFSLVQYSRFKLTFFHELDTEQSILCTKAYSVRVYDRRTKCLLDLYIGLDDLLCLVHLLYIKHEVANKDKNTDKFVSSDPQKKRKHFEDNRLTCKKHDEMNKKNL